MIGFDEIKNKLSRYVAIETIDIKKGDFEDDTNFNIEIKFTTPINEKFKIVWWANIGYFHFNLGVKNTPFINFDDIEFLNTYPMYGKNLLSLRLKYKKELAAVIPIEGLENE
jgi:hypothetical protein